MKTYNITTVETVENYYTVTAESEEQARDDVLSGELNTSNFESTDCFISQCTVVA